MRPKRKKIKAAKTKLRSLKLFLIQFKFLDVKFWGKGFFSPQGDEQIVIDKLRLKKLLR